MKKPDSKPNGTVLTLFGIITMLLGTHALGSENNIRQMSIDPVRPNSIVFAPVEARFVRVDVAVSRGSEVCFDELEVYAPNGRENLAAAKSGASALASSCLEGYASHRIEHLNDGRYGNGRSWICGQKEGWAQIELPTAMTVDCVVFSRDREGRYQDRVPSRVSVSISLDGENWKRVAAIDKTYPVKLESAVLLPNRPIELDFPLQLALAVRVVISGTNNGAQPCIDELEVYGESNRSNLALGGKVAASSTLDGYAIHQIKHLNDGRYGNAHSWICGQPSGWAQVTLPKVSSIRRVVLSRDRKGDYRGRIPTDFEIQLSLDGHRWNVVKRIAALRDLAVDQRVDGESPEAWASRIALALPAALGKIAYAKLDDVDSFDDVEPLLKLYRLDQQREQLASRVEREFNPAALRRAVADLTATFPDLYRPPSGWESTLKQHEANATDLLRKLRGDNFEQIRAALSEAKAILAFQREVLLANPLLDFEELLVLKRKTPKIKGSHPYWRWGQKYGLTVNWSSDFRPKNPTVAAHWDDEIAAVEWSEPNGQWRTVLEPPPRHMLQHPELDFEAQRLLVTMPDSSGAFQVFEVQLDGSGLRQITHDTGPDIDNGDACYLPDGRIVFNSTRMFTGVPCEDGASTVSNLCLTDADGNQTRMLTFDQESNWHPSVLNNGRVLFTRYEYANISHQFGRLLFHMNPDGTGQAEYYGSNSYWPNSIFHARPIPGHPTMVIGVVCGHHGPNKTGRLVLFDPALGRRETSGAVQTIPGHGKPVERIVEDVLYGDAWPKFVHPWPLSDKYFLVSARLHPEQDDYAVYLVDVFDNITEVLRLEGCSLMEPIPVKPRPQPPAICDRVDPNSRRATVFLADVYEGEGLRDVPRGTIKKLRLFTYNYVYRDTRKRGFGHLATPGVDGPWEPRYLLGTVPVRTDGSAAFEVPANTPISIQPLDDQGRAVQLMRSWFTAMPGEVLSCMGCHENLNTSPLASYVTLSKTDPDEIQPWRGPPRGFDFEREVQPVLDRFCVGCHDGSKPDRPDLSRKSEEEKQRINEEYHARTEAAIRTIFTPSFIALHPYVRRPHAESHYGLQVPGEYLADTSPLIQMLQKGHHNVQLEEEAWDRFYTWIDLGAPDHGSWKFSEWGVPENYYERRLESLRRFAGRTDDVEAIPPMPDEIPVFVRPPERRDSAAAPSCPGWSFDETEAKRRQRAVDLPSELNVQLSEDLSVRCMLIPAGEFMMGDPEGPGDEIPVKKIQIERPFYMGCTEVTNAQFRAVVSPSHNSGHEGWRSIDWRGEGYDLNADDQPVVRVSWDEATQFCERLSETTGLPIKLPTEAQWEWACRAGTATPLWYGEVDGDFSAFENLAGKEQRQFAFKKKRKWYLRDDRYDDNALVTTAVSSYRANPWGLYDMHGNASEWTRSIYSEEFACDLEESLADCERVVRGGSWYVRPQDATSSSRWKYPPWRRVFNVGFRIVVETDQ